MKKNFFSILLVLFLFSCSNTKNSNITKYTNETECVKDNFDGTYVIKAWGTGMNIKDQIISAQKKALNDILFVGLTYGKGECGGAPVVAEPNARKKYEDYFNTFFSENGDFKKYIEVLPGANVYKNQVVTLVVKKSDLKQKLIKEGIIKQ
ncbi:MAG: hypothetical protein HYU67_12860 [Flavobacteriia bacterium]|nr:hypothetical protein [Flavobacteriia bacterium]